MTNTDIITQEIITVVKLEKKLEAAKKSKIFQQAKYEKLKLQDQEAEKQSLGAKGREQYLSNSLRFQLSLCMTVTYHKALGLNSTINKLEKNLQYAKLRLNILQG